MQSPKCSLLDEQIPSALNPHSGHIPNANAHANPNAHYQPPM
jgi:hypothetical protein